MSDNNTTATTTEKSNKGILVVVVLVILAVIVYAVTQGKDAPTVSEQETLALTDENLITTWRREADGIVHDLCFEVGNGLVYAEFEKGKVSPKRVTTDGAYKIAGNMIEVSFQIDMEDYAEKYLVKVTAEQIVLTPAEGSGGTIAGTYKNAELTDSSTTDTGGKSSKTSLQTTAKTSKATKTSTTQSQTTTKATKTSSTQVSANWKTDYLRFIDAEENRNFVNYKLVYLDGDDIPELFMSADYEAAGEKICTVSNGRIVSWPLYRLGGSYYIERSGLLMKSNGHMGSYYTCVYSLENGQFTTLLDGSYQEAEGSYTYYLNSVIVGEEAYYEAVSARFDPAKGVSLSDGTVGYAEIVNQISSR